MSDWIGLKTFRTMVTLFIFRFESCSWWAGDTCFSVPEWFVARALTFVVDKCSSSKTFTFFIYLVDLSWKIAITFTSLFCGIVFGTCWAASALFGNNIEIFSWGGITLHTIVINFIISCSTFELFVIIPSQWWISWVDWSLTEGSQN